LLAVLMVSLFPAHTVVSVFQYRDYKMFFELSEWLNEIYN
jgi:hypothetical protein